MVYQRMFSESVVLWLRVKRAMQLTAMSLGFASNDVFIEGRCVFAKSLEGGGDRWKFESYINWRSLGYNQISICW